MMTTLYLLLNIALLPLLLVGVMRKVKALMQTRIGAPILQPFYDVAKLLRKGETISETAGWVFVWAPRIGLALTAMVAVLVPWTGWLPPAGWAGATNFLLVLYVLALSKFLGMLAAMDTGSAFGGLGASREAMISLLVEPALMIGLGALAVGAGSTDLAGIYGQPIHPLVALLVGAALVMAALAELSRMPVDDPTTHLELTMVHEAMILENSGRNLALVEYAVALKACLFFGLAAHTLWHLWPGFLALEPGWRYLAGIGGLFGLGVAVAIAEGVLVKLNWRRVPHFLVIALMLSLCAALVAVTR
ncbi:MAG: respiratory chain complex I subunit 1 family protein [Thiohalomonadaceae bacterium]